MSMQNYVRWNTCQEALQGIRSLKATGKSVGSVHSLGDLHIGHAKLIEQAAAENDYVVVTIYPNKEQLSKTHKYVYDPDRDCEFSASFGATHFVTLDESEIYPPDYCTFLSQGELYSRLDGIVMPTIFKGMITMSIRWIIFTRPDRTYFGLKDISQYLLVSQAVKDLMIDTEVVAVPCVRYRSGIAISSRLMRLPREKLQEFQRVYQTLEEGRKIISSGVTDAETIIARMKDFLNPDSFSFFKLKYIKLADPRDLTEPKVISVPVIIHIVLSDTEKNYFEGFLIRSQQELTEGPETIWLEDEYPLTGSQK
ncbi:Pantothenate synthetase [Serratia quinivorans]|uniref:pantoate--beta-alanine ligase n=1 Tax=Serratia quinivorans TaxID=137545 RepID=UPI002177F5FE|nr:pantoate--beta-alanine ligase [Serratia quinivorans]CAI1900529.1 Pantothenate synthetase [Serratia quinivorans]